MSGVEIRLVEAVAGSLTDGIDRGVVFGLETGLDAARGRRYSRDRERIRRVVDEHLPYAAA